jgi:hypothetical protein
MSEIKDGGPAFPCQATINRDSGELIPHQFGNDDFVVPGVSMRDYFAAKALMGLLAEPISEGMQSTTSYIATPLEHDQPGDLMARSAYRLADAMLKARAA